MLNLRTLRFFLVLCFAAASWAQTPGTSGFGSRRSPQDLVPGLIVRGYFGDYKDKPTHQVCVVQNIEEWFDKYRTMAANELRGVAKSSDLNYLAFGYVSVDKDTEVVFEMKDATCRVNEKDFGSGSYRHTFKKGKYPIEVGKRHGKGESKFTIAAAGGQNVLFHTGEMLNRELNRGIKIEGRTYRSKLIGSQEPAKPGASNSSPVGAPTAPAPATAAARPAASAPVSSVAPITTLPTGPTAPRSPLAPGPAIATVTKPAPAPAPAVPAPPPASGGDTIEKRMVGTKWFFPMDDKPMSDQWVAFKPDGQLVPGWNPDAKRPWKMVSEDTVEFRPMGYQRAVYRIQFDPTLKTARLISGDRGKRPLERLE